jgi:hypothetical protein
LVEIDLTDIMPLYMVRHRRTCSSSAGSCRTATTFGSPSCGNLRSERRSRPGVPAKFWRTDRPAIIGSAAEAGRPRVRGTALQAPKLTGVVHFREDAPWLDELMAELLGFPGARHDDQVVSISQALAFVNWRESHRISLPRVAALMSERPGRRMTGR